MERVEFFFGLVFLFGGATGAISGLLPDPVLVAAAMGILGLAIYTTETARAHKSALAILRAGTTSASAPNVDWLGERTREARNSMVGRRAA